MAFSSISKTPCATCDNKGVGILKCEGCGQVFCRKHVIEHRDNLSHQLDEIVLQYDTLQQIIIENNDKQDYSNTLIKQIDKWERDAIEKIQQIAEEQRQQVIKLTHSKTDVATNKLHDLAERLQKARIDDDYFENDLEIWRHQLDKLKYDITSLSSSITIIEDPTKMLINKIYLSIENQQLDLEEQFGEFFGDIVIKNNGCVAEHANTKNSDVYVRGTKEYSKGKHRIRFIINKRTTDFVMSFNVIPKSLPISESSKNDRYFAYGWHTGDFTNNPDKNIQEFQDLKGETMLELEFLVDCDNRKISYFNERTKNIRKMNVNIEKCPFPWQLQFYLYDIGDRVQLVTSNQVS